MDDEDEEEINIPEVGAVQLTNELAGENPPYLIDVREAWEVARGMIPGGIHIPMNDIPDRLADIPQDKPVVIYCASGARSYAVTGFLIQNGFNNVRNLDSGIQGWAMVQMNRK